MIKRKVLFTTAIDGTNVHEWGTVEDKIVQDGNTAYFVGFLMPNEKHGAQQAYVVITPYQIELIERPKYYLF